LAWIARKPTRYSTSRNFRVSGTINTESPLLRVNAGSSTTNSTHPLAWQHSTISRSLDGDVSHDTAPSRTGAEELQVEDDASPVWEHSLDEGYVILPDDVDYSAEVVTATKADAEAGPLPTAAASSTGIDWLKEETLEILDESLYPLGSLTMDDVAHFDHLMSGWVFRRSGAAAKFVERLLKRLVDDLKAGNKEIRLNTSLYVHVSDNSSLFPLWHRLDSLTLCA
jgi:hypothetical protein